MASRASAVLVPFPVRRPTVYQDDKTAILRPVKGASLSWEDIARDRAFSRPSTDATTVKPLTVVRLAPPPASVPVEKKKTGTPRAKKTPPAPWAKLKDQWGLAAIEDREHERRARVADIPTRPVPHPEIARKQVRKVDLVALLKTPEWKGSSVETERDIPSAPIGVHLDSIGRHFDVHGCHPENSVREWIVLRHPRGAVLRLNPETVVR